MSILAGEDSPQTGQVIFRPVMQINSTKAKKPPLGANGASMIPCDYTTENGKKVVFDLDSVIDVAIGFSKKRQGWSATLIYIPESCAFVELRSSAPDIRGNSKEEAEEVSTAYISEAFAIDNEGLSRIKNNPGSWQLIDRRTGA